MTVTKSISKEDHLESHLSEHEMDLLYLPPWIGYGFLALYVGYDNLSSIGPLPLSLQTSTPFLQLMFHVGARWPGGAVAGDE